VAARGGQFDAAADARVRGIDITIRKTTQGFTASLRIDPADSASALREVHAAECGEVANGLAVVAAIALGARPTEAPPDTAVSTPPPAKHDASTAIAPSVPTPAETPTPRLRGSTFTLPKTIEVAPGTLRFDRAVSYTLGAGIATGILPPQVLPRYDFTISNASFVTPPSGSSYLVGPVLQVRWSWLGPGIHHSSDFSTRALGMLAGVSSCSAITYDSEGMVLLVCGEFGVGWMRFRTESADRSFDQSKDVFLGTAGIAVDGQYNLGSHFHVGLRLGSDAQFGSLSAERPDGTEIFKSSVASVYAVGGVGFHFW
jgi:hypothetical protein